MRAAVPADLAVLQDVFRRASLNNEHDRAVLLAAPDALVWTGESLDRGRTWVAEDGDGRIRGFASTTPCGPGVELEDLFVAPEYMRTGVATALIRVLVERAVATGAPWIEVTANPHAAAFYASAGFAQIGTAETRFARAPRLRLPISEEPR